MNNNYIRVRHILCLISMLIGLNAYAQTDSDHSKKFNAAQTPYQFQWDMDVVSDYRSRGLTQTFGMPAVQGGVGLMLPNHFYVGNWNSTVSSGAGYPGALLETDLFGGWAQQIDEYHINTGIYGIIYPGSNVSNYVFSPFKTGMSSGMVHNGAVFFAVQRGPFSVQQNIAFTNFESMLSPTGASTAGSAYTNLTGNFPMSSWTWADGGWSLIAHAGYQYVANYSAASYVDWKLGIEKKFASMWSANLAYTQTNANGNCSAAAISAQPYCVNKYTNSSGIGSGPTMNSGGAALFLTIKLANY